MNFDKPPQENFGNKRVNFELDIEGAKIQCEKYEFLYPEKIQQETGILGYERVKIPQESLKETSVEGILLNLSGGEYPNQTFNHRLGADVSVEQAKKYHVNFKDDKFFLQKIFDMERLNKSFKEIELGIPTKDRFKYYQKSNNDFINASGNVGSISLIENLKTNQNKNEVYAIGPEGLNTKCGAMWGDKDVSLASFGFSPEDSFYHEYLIKSLGLYRKLYQEDPATYLHPITNIIGQMIMQDKHLRHLYEIRDENHRYSLAKEVVEEADLNLNQYVKEKINNLLEKFQLDFITDENVDKYVREKYQLPERYKEDVITHIVGEINEPDIPVIINHDEIPQLSWGHAKYAHYSNEKGLNFFKFKHLEHLPEKE